MSTKYQTKQTNLISTDFSQQNPTASVGAANAWVGLIADASISPNVRTVDFASLANTSAAISVIGMRIINPATDNRQVEVKVTAGSPNASISLAIGGSTPIGISLPINTVMELMPGVFVSSNGTINTIIFKDIPMIRGNLLQIFANTISATLAYSAVCSVRSVV